MNDTEKFKILIVDDERANIIALNNILKPTYTTLAAINGEMAIEVATKSVPDLILLDIILPDITGFEVLTRLMEIKQLCKIPVIFITGLDSVADEEKGLALGAVDYITKPFHGAIVTARVKTHLQIREYVNTIEKMSMTDMLTDVLNRRGLSVRLNIEWDRAKRECEPISILMIDIDKFKNYNDTYGHLQGDERLKCVAGVIKQLLRRSTDLVARWGGEEFIVVLPNTNLDGAMEIASGIRVAVEQKTSEGETCTTTVSIGINTQIPNIQSSMEEHIAGADKALYDAKESGRNRICCFKK